MRDKKPMRPGKRRDLAMVACIGVIDGIERGGSGAMDWQPRPAWDIRAVYRIARRIGALLHPPTPPLRDRHPKEYRDGH